MGWYEAGEYRWSCLCAARWSPRYQVTRTRRTPPRHRRRSRCARRDARSPGDQLEERAPGHCARGEARQERHPGPHAPLVDTESQRAQVVRARSRPRLQCGSSTARHRSEGCAVMGSWTIRITTWDCRGIGGGWQPNANEWSTSSTTGTTERDRGVGGRFNRQARPIVGNERQLVGNRGTAFPPVLASSRATLVHLLSRLRFSAAGTRRFAVRRVGALRWLRRHRVMVGCSLDSCSQCVQHPERRGVSRAGARGGRYSVRRRRCRAHRPYCECLTMTAGHGRCAPRAGREACHAPDECGARAVAAAGARRLYGAWVARTGNGRWLEVTVASGVLGVRDQTSATRVRTRDSPSEGIRADEAASAGTA